MGKFSSYFLNGVIVLVPIVITLFVVMWVFNLTESLVGRFLPQFLHFTGVALLIVIGLIVLIGWLSQHWAMQRLIEWGENMLNRIPGIKFIYSSVKQLSTAVLESKSLLKQPVLVPFPHPESKAMGFLVGEDMTCFSERLPEDTVCVFVPMSLNMTAGFNIMVSKKDIIMLDISSESALQFTLTAGALLPRKNGEYIGK